MVFLLKIAQTAIEFYSAPELTDYCSYYVLSSVITLGESPKFYIKVFWVKSYIHKDSVCEMM